MKLINYSLVSDDFDQHFIYFPFFYPNFENFCLFVDGANSIKFFNLNIMSLFLVFF